MMPAVDTALAPDVLDDPEEPSVLPAADEPAAPVDVLQPWLRAQALNVTRHAAALRPFTRAEFGNGPTAPSEGHLKVVNDLIAGLRRGLLKMSKRATTA